MPIFGRGEVSIYYEDSEEDLPAVLLLAPGGMKSSLRFWEGTPWDPRVHLKGKFRVVAMDQETRVTQKLLYLLRTAGIALQLTRSDSWII